MNCECGHDKKRAHLDGRVACALCDDCTGYKPANDRAACDAAIEFLSSHGFAGSATEVWNASRDAATDEFVRRVINGATAGEICYLDTWIVERMEAVAKEMKDGK